MHNSYHFLSRWVSELHDRILGAKLEDCFSQTNNELVIEFSKETSFFLKTHVSNEFSYNTIKEDFSRAKRNVRPWFQELRGYEVSSFSVFENERAFFLDFKNTSARLIFKMYGNRANIIFFAEPSSVKGVFNKKLQADFQLPYDLSRELDLSMERYLLCTPKQFLPTFDKTVWSYLEDQSFSVLDQATQFNTLIHLNDFLMNSQITVSKSKGKPQLLLVPHDSEVVWQGFGNEEALTVLERVFFSEYSFLLEKQRMILQEKKVLKKLERDLAKLSRRLGELIDGTNKKELADVIMAYLHLLKPGTTVEVFNFYSEEMISISIAKNETPQQVAGKLYRKYKSQHIQEKNIRGLIDSKSIEIDKVIGKVARIEQIADWKKLRKLRGAVISRKKVAPVATFKEFDFFGYKIFVGKNSKNNDELTLKFAKKEDLWLHAKDVAGSHVVVKKQGDAQVPKNVIEYAATLAGKYSKRKNDSLCPVTVTEKKFVRKVKGAPAGAVVVEREKVLLVKLN